MSLSASAVSAVMLTVPPAVAVQVESELSAPSRSTIHRAYSVGA